MVTVPLTAGKYSGWFLNTCLSGQDDLAVIVAKEKSANICLVKIQSIIAMI